MRPIGSALAAGDQWFRTVALLFDLFRGEEWRLLRWSLLDDFSLSLRFRLILSLLLTLLRIALRCSGGLRLSSEIAVGSVVIGRYVGLLSERRLSRLARRAAALALFESGRLVDRFYDPIIMLGVLQVVFRSDPVACTRRVTRQGLVFLIDLPGIAADTDVEAVAVEILMTQGGRRAWPVIQAGHALPRAVSVAATAATTVAAMAAVVTAAAATTTVMTSTRTPAVGTLLSHAITCCSVFKTLLNPSSMFPALFDFFVFRRSITKLLTCK
jgi:hypothetical protein